MAAVGGDLGVRGEMMIYRVSIFICVTYTYTTDIYIYIFPAGGGLGVMGEMMIYRISLSICIEYKYTTDTMAVNREDAGYHNREDAREDASTMVTAGATANTTEGNSRASRESGLLCSHSHGESIALGLTLTLGNRGLLCLHSHGESIAVGGSGEKSADLP